MGFVNINVLLWLNTNTVMVVMSVYFRCLISAHVCGLVIWFEVHVWKSCKALLFQRGSRRSAAAHMLGRESTGKLLC